MTLWILSQYSVRYELFTYLQLWCAAGVNVTLWILNQYSVGYDLFTYLQLWCAAGVNVTLWILSQYSVRYELFTYLQLWCAAGVNVPLWILNQYSLRYDLFTYLQLWCAAGVNVTLGKTKDGGSVVGASVFYSTPPGGSGDAPSQKCADDVERLDSELKVGPGFLLCSLLFILMIIL